MNRPFGLDRARTLDLLKVQGVPLPKFDPWTITPEEAAALDAEDPLGRGWATGMLSFVAAVNKRRARIESKPTRGLVIHALEICLMARLPVPEWLADAFLALDMGRKMERQPHEASARPRGPRAPRPIPNNEKLQLDIQGYLKAQGKIHGVKAYLRKCHPSLTRGQIDRAVAASKIKKGYKLQG